MAKQVQIHHRGGCDSKTPCLRVCTSGKPAEPKQPWLRNRLLGFVCTIMVLRKRGSVVCLHLSTSHSPLIAKLLLHWQCMTRQKCMYCNSWLLHVARPTRSARCWRMHGNMLASPA